MAKTRNKKHENRVKKLTAMVILCAVVLSVSTYAWFIGMKTVNINSFDINIKSTEGLFLSMDGKNWSYNLNVDKTANPYAGHTNTFAENGLIPMSSVGAMNEDASTMQLFEKGSLTATPGGMRLLASKVENETIDTANNKIGGTEGEGYVAFDLFVKNISGKAYYAGNDPLNEEAIYLTKNSTVKVGAAGAEATDDQKNTGIENSVRVGFAQIGRVDAKANEGATADADVAKITNITCKDNDTDGVTGICRKAQIWEPNDAIHAQNALNWFKTSCKLRTGATVTEAASYGEACPVLDKDTAYSTYAISDVVDITDNVNIYDGADYNGYTKADSKLVDFPYFTDSMKVLQGTQRPQFMTLAPNSITKIRVYIWLEGQDIDNYDFASLGEQIAINFGFTKERYKEEDVSYDKDNSPSTNVNNEKTDDKTTEQAD